MPEHPYPSTRSPPRRSDVAVHALTADGLHFGLETALDELSYELGIDPVELRRRNYTDVNPTTGERFSSRFLLDCYKLGADAFGWFRRSSKPGSTRDGREFVGWGMATEAHDHAAFPSSAMVRMAADGTVLSQTATQDIGTGTYTVFTQVVADALGVPLNQVKVELADTNLPPAALSAGSGTIASVTGAVNAAALAVRTAVVQLAVSNPASPLHGLPAEQVIKQHGYLFSPDRSRRESYRAVMARHGAPVENTSSMTNARGLLHRGGPRRSPGRSALRPSPRDPRSRRVRRGPRDEPPDRTQPGRRRIHVGHR